MKKIIKRFAKKVGFLLLISLVVLFLVMVQTGVISVSHSPEMTPKRPTNFRTGENISFIGLNTLDAKQISPVTGKKGIGEWIETPAGKFQILSYWAGTSGNESFPFLLDGLIKEDLYIEEPTLELISGQNISSIRFFIPKLAPFQSSKPLTFKKTLSFPFIANIDQKEKEISMTVLLKASVCNDKGCTPLQQEFSISLGADESWPTSFSSYVQYNLMFIPSTVDKDKLKVNLLDENTILVAVHSDEDFSPEKILIREKNRNKTFAIKKQDVRGEYSFLEIVFREKLQFPLTITLKTDGQVWERQINESDESFSVPLPVKESKSFFWKILLFLVLSPLTVHLLGLSFKNDFESRKKSLLILGFLLIGWAVVCAFYLFYPIEASWAYNPVWLSFVLLVFCLYYFRPSLGNALVLTAIFPWYFLQDLYYANQYALLTLVGFWSIFPYIIFIAFPHTGTLCSAGLNSISERSKKIPLWIDTFYLVGKIIFVLFFQ